MPKDRIPHKENKGITIVAKPATKVVAFVLVAIIMFLIMLGVNLVIAAS